VKVVLFCGGLGTRIRDYSDAVPKPMVPVGDRPILWHVMKYYAHFGHNDFILCLGYKGSTIKDYFRHYDETVSNDFVLSDGGRTVELIGSDIDDWRITFVDTGPGSNIGDRLRLVRRYVGNDTFLANYADGLTDLDLDAHIQKHQGSGAVATHLVVPPPSSFHMVTAEPDGQVTSIGPVRSHDLWVNAGYFVFEPEIFDYLQPGEELVAEPFRRLIGERKLMANQYGGFWAVMDTFRDKQALDELWEFGAPWELWRGTRPISDATGGGGSG
jgi:glucose-1-phosphate cytidylyltransferase